MYVMYVGVDRATFSQHKESHGSHGNLYAEEQEQCCSILVGALCGELRIPSSAGHVLASLWLEPLVSQGSQEIFLVPPPTPTYLLRLHIYISAFVLHFNGVVVLVCCCFSTTVAMLGPTLTPMASLSRGSASVQCTLQMALKPEGYITLIM